MRLLDVTYSEDIKRSPELSALAEQASRRLGDEIMGRFGLPTRAEWDRVQEGGRTCLSLRLSDETGEYGAKLDPTDLKDPDRMRDRLDDVWDHVLMVRSHRLAERVQATSNGEDN